MELPPTTEPSSDYRTRIYATYASQFQRSNLRFDAAAAARWGRTFKKYSEGWLPQRKDAAILDLACGNGYLLYFFKQEGYTKITGVDISPEQVALSRQVVPDVIEGSILDVLENHHERFDLITGIDIIEHLKKDEVLRFLDAAVGALRPGGRLVLQTPNADSPMIGTLRYGDFTHEVIFNQNSLGSLLTLAGLRRIEAREQGPVPHGIVSFSRYCLWALLRRCLWFWNLVETGAPGSGIFTRVFIISGIKE